MFIPTYALPEASTHFSKTSFEPIGVFFSIELGREYSSTPSAASTLAIVGVVTAEEGEFTSFSVQFVIHMTAEVGAQRSQLR